MHQQLCLSKLAVACTRRQMALAAAGDTTRHSSKMHSTDRLFRHTMIDQNQGDDSDSGADGQNSVA
jgi:hypothetical protein